MRCFGFLSVLLAVASLFLTSNALAGECGGKVACECGDTVSRAGHLTADIGPCAGPYGLILTKRSRLHGHGFRIRGSGDAGSIGVLSQDGSSVSISDLVIENFETGLVIENTPLIKLSGVETTGGQNGIEIHGPARRARIKYLDVHDNANLGLYVGPGVRRFDLGRSSFANNGVINLFVDGVEKPRIKTNTFEGAMLGLAFDNVYRGTLSNNSIRDVTLLAGNSVDNRFSRDELGQLVITASETAPGVIGYPIGNRFRRVDFDTDASPCIDLSNTWDNEFEGGSIRCGEHRHVRATADQLPEGVPFALNRTTNLPMPRVLDPVQGERSSVETDANSILDAWFRVGGVVETTSGQAVIGASVSVTNGFGEVVGTTTTSSFGLTEDTFLLPGFFSANNQDFPDVHVMRATKSGLSAGTTEFSARQDITYLVRMGGGGGGTVPVGNPYPAWFPQGSQISNCPVVPVLRQVEIMAVASGVSNDQWQTLPLGAINAGNHGGNLFVATLEFGYATTPLMDVNGLQMEQIDSQQVFCTGSNVIGGWVRIWRAIGFNIQSGTLTYRGFGPSGSQASTSVLFN